MHQRTYHIADKSDSRKLTEFLCKERQFLLPMVELITGAEMAVDELIEVTGRATIEAVLTLSAQEIAGPKHPGKATGEITCIERLGGLPESYHWAAAYRRPPRRVIPSASLGTETVCHQLRCPRVAGRPRCVSRPRWSHESMEGGPHV